EFVKQAGGAVHVHLEVGKAARTLEQGLEGRFTGRFDEPGGSFHEGAGPGDVAPTPVIGAGEEAEAPRQLGVQAESLRFSAEIGQVAGQLAGVAQTDAGVEQDADEVELGSDALGGGEALSVAAAESDEPLGVGVGEHAETSSGGTDAGGRAGGAG